MGKSARELGPVRAQKRVATNAADAFVYIGLTRPMSEFASRNEVRTERDRFRNDDSVAPKFCEAGARRRR
jgi:hypothetical protein